MNFHFGNMIDKVCGKVHLTRLIPKQIHFRFAMVAYNTENYEKAKAEWLEVTRKKLAYLNNLLAKNEYVTGKRLSYIDIMLFDFLLVIGTFEPKLLEENPNLARHLKSINSLPQISNYRAGKGKGECRLDFQIVLELEINLNPLANLHSKFSHHRCLEGEDVLCSVRYMEGTNVNHLGSFVSASEFGSFLICKEFFRFRTFQ